MQRLFAVVGLLLFVGGCSSSPSPSQTTPSGQAIPTGTSSGLVSNLATQVTSLGLTGSSALAAQAASLALQAGVQATPVSLTASSLAASSPPGANALSRSGAVGQGGAGYAFAFQLTANNSPQGPSTQVFTGVMFFADKNDFALAAAAGANAIFGLVVSGATQVWVASAGQESADPGTVSGACPITPAAYITACNQATFTNAGFNITASTPHGDATGSEIASIENTTLAGVELTVDCSKTPLCGMVVPGLRISPSMWTMQVGTQETFTALLGDTPTSVDWTITGSPPVGTLSPTGPSNSTTYSAPGTAGGPFTLTATSLDSSETASAMVTVTARAVVSVSINPGSANIGPNESVSFTAAVSGTSPTTVYWTATGSGGGPFGTFSNAGPSNSTTYTAPAAIGSYTVVATSVEDTNATAMATVTVSASGSNFAGYWDGPFSIPQLTPSTGTAYVFIDAGPDNQLFINSPNFLCQPKNPDPLDAGPQAILATQTSPTSFVLVPTYSLPDGGPPPCALPYSTCPQVPYGSLSVAGGTGVLSNGELFMTFDGGTVCSGVTTLFTGTYGPGVNQNGL
jgi:hypothetical protein